MTAAPAAGDLVRVEDLKLGPLLAEGGEGRVFQLPRQPHLLFKAYRDGTDRPYLESMVRWPATVAPGQEAAVRASAAWPTAVVAGDTGRPIGLLVPRAPRRFSVRHRDGRSRLASLSYLTADPAHRAAAYGLELPAPASASRVGLVHSLARLLAAFQAGPDAVGHGDLSTKNVLWSLQRRPEMFVIDCDNSEIFRADGTVVGGPDRRRAMTPNWDDPAVERGSNPTLASDLYSLALIFLRVVGAANFPIQARQRAGGPVQVEFPVAPGPGSDALLDRHAPVWEMCARALSITAPDDRPPAAAWLPELERILRAMGATSWLDDAEAAPGPSWQAGPLPSDVTVVPVPGERRGGRTWSRPVPAPRYPARPQEPGGPGPGGLAWRALGAQGGGRPAAGSAPPTRSGGGEVVSGVAVWPEIRILLARAGRWWLALHRATLLALLTPGRRRRGLGSAAFCLMVDLVIAVIVLLFGAMITAPVLGL